MTPPNVTPAKGVHRLSIDLPIDVWNAILVLAAKDGSKPIPTLKQIIADAVERRSKR